MFTAYLSLGSNLGQRELYLNKAIQLLEQENIVIQKISPVYQSQALGFESPDKFLNLCLKICTLLQPESLLSTCLDLEQEIGRIRSTSPQYISRVIDIDILLYEDLCINTPQLILPHPRYHERKFVLVPLNDIDPNCIDPNSQRTISQLLEACPDQSQLEPFTPLRHFNI